MISFQNQKIKVQADEWGNSFVVQGKKQMYRTNMELPAFYTDERGIRHFLTEESPKIHVLEEKGRSGVRYDYEYFSLEMSVDEEQSALRFDVRVTEKTFAGEIYWPAPLKMEGWKKGYAVLPIMQGMLLFNGEADCRNLMDGEFVTREGTMPWWGQVEESGGYMAVTDTLWDAKYLYEHKKNQATDIRICWMPSLGSLSYDRSMTLYFYDEACTYVDFCKKYRDLLETNGELLTLEDKMENTPLVREMMGRPVCYTPAAYYQIEPESTYYDKEDETKNFELNPFSSIGDGLRRLYDAGLKKMYVHMDGWSYGGYDNLCPRVLPPNPQAGGEEGLKDLLKTCEELDCLMAYHDQYRDYYLKSPDYDEKNAVVSKDGCIGNREEIIWYGGHEVQLCSTKAMGYLKRNYEEMEQAGILPKGVYLDVFSASALDECFSKEHPMSKRDCARLRKECFAYLHAKGLIVSSEEIMSEFVNDLDLVHHSPYVMPFFEAYKVQPFGTCVPLLSLVYHDCIVTPWFMGDEVWGLPKGESGFLNCLLCGGLPVVDFDADTEQIRKVEIACELYRKVGTSQMILHEFLSEDRKLQKSVFENGIKVIVDFQKNEYQIDLRDYKK